MSNGPESNLYGLQPNFGCCTANFHQGWPKFVSNLWMKTSDGGLAVVAYAPCVIETTIQGKPVKVSVETEYPFRSEIGLRVTVPEPMSFPLRLRLPRWAERISILNLRDAKAPDHPALSEKGDEVHTQLDLTGDWKGTRGIAIDLGMKTELYPGDNGAVAIRRGPLVFALPIEPEWKKVRDHQQFADWEVYPKSPWNYALQVDPNDLEESLRFLNRGVGVAPFSPSGSPVVAKVKGRRLPGWGLVKGAAAPAPRSPVKSTEPLETLTLIPYGSTDLRITEFPTLASP